MPSAKAPREWSVGVRRPAADGWYVLPEPPSANRWWRKFRNRMVLSAEARAYIRLVRATIPARLHAGPVELAVEWHRGAKRGDLDKRLGIIQDALQGVLVRNDAQVTRIVASRHEAPGHAHLRVRVTPLADPPTTADACVAPLRSLDLAHPGAWL